ncbi:MAG: hypothetical protein HZA52_19855 [Planctomycetes bacterium]|nr:hypothetical protein [Planctomycetota bacterium]
MLADIDGTIKTLVFVLFFLAPVVKSIIDAKKKQREAAERLGRTPTDDATAGRSSTDDAASAETSTEDAGRAAWEALLRGEVLEPPEVAESRRPTPPTPPSAPGRVEPRPRRTLEDSGTERPYAPAYAPSLGEEVARAPRTALSSEGISPEGREVLTDSKALTATRGSFESEVLTESPALTDSIASTESPALTDTPTFEGTGIAKLVAQGKFQGLGTASVASEVSAEPRRLRARALAQSRADWRRAIVLSEVLAPPVSMRRQRAGDLPGVES